MKQKLVGIMAAIAVVFSLQVTGGETEPCQTTDAKAPVCGECATVCAQCSDNNQHEDACLLFPKFKLNFFKSEKLKCRLHKGCTVCAQKCQKCTKCGKVEACK